IVGTCAAPVKPYELVLRLSGPDRSSLRAQAAVFRIRAGAVRLGFKVDLLKSEALRELEEDVRGGHVSIMGIFSVKIRDQFDVLLGFSGERVALCEAVTEGVSLDARFRGLDVPGAAQTSLAKASREALNEAAYVCSPTVLTSLQPQRPLTAGRGGEDQ